MMIPQNVDLERKAFANPPDVCSYMNNHMAFQYLHLKVPAADGWRHDRNFVEA